MTGATIDSGETIVETAEREVRQETGLDVNVDGNIGTFSDPRHTIEYSDGEVRQQFDISFHAMPHQKGSTRQHGVHRGAVGSARAA